MASDHRREQSQKKETTIPTIKVNFHPDIDGFAFTNSWTFEASEKDAIYSVFDTVAFAVVLGIPFPLLPLPPDPISRLVFVGILRGLIDKQLSQPYGLCGGMAYAALDYYKANLIIERGFGDSQPNHTTLRGGKLREYLWKRMLDSVTSGGAAFRTLEWMFVLHVLSGAGSLLAWTKDEWVKVKQYIDSGTPWPICLIGTANSPFNNHQVLAYGYTDNGGGTGTLFVYDNNCPNMESTINLDFRGTQLQATESCGSSARGPLKGFFCSAYHFNAPPVVVGLLQNVATTPAPPIPGQMVTVNYTVTNAGFGPTPKMKLSLRGLQATRIDLDPLHPEDEPDQVLRLTAGADQALFPTDEAGQAVRPSGDAGQVFLKPPPDGPGGEHRYVYKTYFWNLPEVEASLLSLYSNTAPHGPAPTNPVSRSLAAPVKTTLPKENSTWTFYGRATLRSDSGITSFKLLPTGLVKQSKGGKEVKETKEGKETKETKDTKEISKDRKDGKEALSKETISKEQDTVTSLRGLSDAEPGELSFDDSQATEQAFIRPDERPDVGGNVMRAAGERQGLSR